jgi:hypothetical protein
MRCVRLSAAISLDPSVPQNHPNPGGVTARSPGNARCELYRPDFPTSTKRKPGSRALRLSLLVDALRPSFSGERRASPPYARAAALAVRPPD